MMVSCAPEQSCSSAYLPTVGLEEVVVVVVVVTVVGLDAVLLDRWGFIVVFVMATMCVCDHLALWSGHSLSWIKHFSTQTVILWGTSWEREQPQNATPRFQTSQNVSNVSLKIE